MSLHKVLVYVAFGWLTFAGTMHFLIDMLAQYLRHKRAPGSETTSYYGLNTAYALGQIVFGILGLLVAHRAIEVLGNGQRFCSAACLRWHGLRSESSLLSTRSRD